MPGGLASLSFARTGVDRRLFDIDLGEVKDVFANAPWQKTDPHSGMGTHPLAERRQQGGLQVSASNSA